MATTGIHFWSTTAATNATADSGVNWAEGQAPASVNDSARALMASAAKTYKDIAGTITTGGTSTAYTMTTNQVFASAAAMSGAMITFIPHVNSGADPTLAVDGLTARQIRTSPGINIPLGGLIAGAPYTVSYIHASTEFILHSAVGVFGNIAVSSLGVNGPLTVQTTASVGGATTFASTVSVGGALTVTGAISGASTVSATGVTASGAISGATAAGAMLASQAEQETGTATNKVVQPGVQHFHKSASKLWAKFNGSSTVADSYNVTGVAKTGTGAYTVTVGTDFSGVDYGVSATAQDNVLVLNAFVTTTTAGTFSVQVVDMGGTAQDPDFVHVTAFGDFA